jgi:hypothetical protein
LKRALHDGQIVAKADYELASHEWEPKISDEADDLIVQDPLVGPERRKVPSSMWATLEQINWRRGFLYDWTAAGAEIYRSVKIKVADLDRLWPTQTSVEHPTEPEQMSLKRAPVETIEAAIRACYEEAKRNGEKPPNVREISEPVQRRLMEQGFEISKNRIEKLAGDSKFKDFRLPAGKRARPEPSN